MRRLQENSWEFVSCTSKRACWLPEAPDFSARISASVHPQGEDYWGHVNPIGPRSCYDEGKRCAETLFFDYWRQHKLAIKVARIFNTYGPRMHSNMAG